MVNRHLDPTVFLLWAEIATENSTLFRLDEVSRSVLFAVGLSNIYGRQPKMTEIEDLIPNYSRATVFSKIRTLSETGWLLLELSERDKRAKLYRLSPLAIAAFDSWSQKIKRSINSGRSKSLTPDFTFNKQIQFNDVR